MSWISSLDIPSTKAPRFGIIVTKPSNSNCLKASRTGVRLTPSSSPIVFSLSSSSFDIFRIKFLPEGYETHAHSGNDHPHSL